MREAFHPAARAGRVAVVGAGLGGLALALRLQSAGVATTLFEKRDKPGGRAYVYEDKGFTFDAGPTVITDPSALVDLFAAAGMRLADRVELLPVEPMYRLCWEDGDCFDYGADGAALEAQIGARAPADVAGYRRFLDYSRDVLKRGYRELGTTPFLSWRDMARAAPHLVRLGSWRSVHDAVASFIGDERLRQVFSFHSLLVGGDPFATSAIYTLIHALERDGGVWFALGGTGALVRALADAFVERGGVLKLGEGCERIVVDGGRVVAIRTEQGAEHRVNAVASNADVVNTYGRLLRGTERGRQEARRLAGKRHSMSLFVVHFGLSAMPQGLAHHTVCFGPRYRRLIAEICGTGGAGLGRLPEDFALYLHSPCVTDLSLAPPGASAHYVLAPVPHLGNAKIDWSVEGPRYRDRILDYLEERYIPNLRRDLVTSRIFTPQDFETELGAHLGSAFSLEPRLTQSAFFRPHNRDAVIPNLYLVGAGTHPGAGVPGVLASARATAQLMIGAACSRPAGEVQPAWA